MTWPAVLHLTGGIPGDGFDGWQNYWNLWWVKRALLIEATNPYFTHLLDAPNGVNLLFHTLNIFNGLWTLPIQLNFGLAVAYNAVVFFSFGLAGYGGFLLALDTLSRVFPAGPRLRLAAFVGGLIFTMSPFHLAHLLGHMQVFSMVWPPFYVLWLLRTLEPWSAPDSLSPRRWRNAPLTSLFLVLATLVDWYHTLYLLIFTGLVVLWTIWQRWRVGQGSNHVPHSTQHSSPIKILQPLWIVFAIVTGFAVILSPLLLPMIRHASSRPDLETGLAQNITLSADLLAYILPSEMHPIWGQWAAGIASNFTTTTSERLIFAGFTPLALAAYIVIRRWPNTIVKFWTFIAAAFAILSLGPFLHVNGQIVTIAGQPLPLPYLLLYYTVPFLNLTRSLSRYNLMVMLSLGVLAAIALVQLTNSSPRIRQHSSLILPLCAAALILFEFLAIPYPISPIDTPQFYYEIARQPEDYVIAELPMNWDRPTPLLHQTTHGKRLLTAYTSRANPLELASRAPVLQQWRYLGPDIIDQPLDQVAPTIFFDFNLRYIVLDYWQMPPGPERDATEGWVAAALPGVEPVYDDGRLKVYQSPPKTGAHPYLSLGNGWGERADHGNGLITRALQPNQPAELFLHHPQNQSLWLEITLTASSGRPTLTIATANETLSQLEAAQNPSTHTIKLPPHNESPQKLTLNAGGPITISRIGLKNDH